MAQGAERLRQHLRHPIRTHGSHFRPFLPAVLAPLLAVYLSLPRAAQGAAHHRGPMGLLRCGPGTEGVCVRERQGVFRLTSTGQNAPHGLMASASHYLYGYFSVRVRLQRGYTGGILTAFYLTDTNTTTNTDPEHAEIDMEIYGGHSRRDMRLGMNVFAGGMHNLVEYSLPFDGFEKFREYAIQWSSQSIIWFVDGHPYRILRRRADRPWPDRPMQVTLSVWDTSAWSALKSDYQAGPISSWFHGFNSRGCASVPNGGPTTCSLSLSPAQPWNRVLNERQLRDYMHWQKQLLIKADGWKPSA